jgi:hypothetical protein
LEIRLEMGRGFLLRPPLDLPALPEGQRVERAVAKDSAEGS